MIRGREPAANAIERRVDGLHLDHSPVVGVAMTNANAFGFGDGADGLSEDNCKQIIHSDL